jgi:hypothetical protein
MNTMTGGFDDGSAPTQATPSAGPRLTPDGAEAEPDATGGAPEPDAEVAAAEPPSQPGEPTPAAAPSDASVPAASDGGNGTNGSNGSVTAANGRVSPASRTAPADEPVVLTEPD